MNSIGKGLANRLRRPALGHRLRGLEPADGASFARGRTCVQSHSGCAADSGAQGETGGALLLGGAM